MSSKSNPGQVIKRDFFHRYPGARDLFNGLLIGLAAFSFLVFILAIISIIALSYGAPLTLAPAAIALATSIGTTFGLTGGVATTLGISVIVSVAMTGFALVATIMGKITRSVSAWFSKHSTDGKPKPPKAPEKEKVIEKDSTDKIKEKLIIEQEKASQDLPSIYETLSNLLRIARKKLEASNDDYQTCIDSLLPDLNKYIDCAKRAGFDTSLLDGIPACLNNPEINTLQLFDEKIFNPVSNFHYDKVFIEKGMMGNSTFKVAELPRELLNLVITEASGVERVAPLSASSKSVHEVFQPRLNQRGIQKLLDCIIYGDPDGAMKILEKNPKLLLEKGNCIAPSGNRILDVTPYECALGAGDNEMAAQIKACFSKLPNGGEEEAKQYAKLKPFIEAMLTQQPSYDLKELINTIIKSSDEDVTAALNCDKNKLPESELWKALEAFRKHFAPREIKEGMHFNYQDLIHAQRAFHHQCSNLKSSKDFSDKLYLFAEQVMGFIQRRLPACERQAFAQGMWWIVYDKEKLQRNFRFRNDKGSFPETLDDNTLSGLGFQSECSGSGRMGIDGMLIDGKFYFETYIFSKSEKLAKLMPSSPRSRNIKGR